MTEFETIERLIAELRQGIDRLESEVRQLRRTENDSAPGSPRSLRGENVPAAGRSVAYDETRAIPPTSTDDPDSIIGGLPTAEFPDCCAIGNEQGYFCTGTLIAPRLVLTAKHCSAVTRVFLRGYDIARPETGETIRVEAQFTHPEEDLRVLVLERVSEVQPRHIAQRVEAQATRALLVGFGTINFDGDFGYGQKRKVEVPVISLECASSGDADRYGCRRGTEIVAGHRGLNRDSCRGDSGGPLYVQTQEGGYSLLGVTSRGVSGAKRMCGDGGIYVRVDKFIRWISEQTGVEIEGPLL